MGLSSYYVLVKEIASELRTRYALNALLMFVVTTLSVIVFSLGSEHVPYEIYCGTLWVIIFFSAMSGLSRTFVTEEERGTTLLLQLITSSNSVLLGKLFYNVILNFAITLITAIAYLILFNDFVVRTYSIFWLTLLLGSVGLASASTILAAIVAKANSKGTLFPVLAFPVLVPILLTAIKATILSVEGGMFNEAFPDFQVLISFTIVIIAVSFLLFDFVWKD
ncbi:MAG: heme exporter protein CcmB [Bacteroidetes bacterium]|nr:heme exporter protein CcmB [Bacteroidota bacterium]